MRISDWSSDVCSSDLKVAAGFRILEDVEASHVGTCDSELAMPRERNPALFHEGVCCLQRRAILFQPAFLPGGSDLQRQPALARSRNIHLQGLCLPHPPRV